MRLSRTQITAGLFLLVLLAAAALWWKRNFVYEQHLRPRVVPYLRSDRLLAAGLWAERNGFASVPLADLDTDLRGLRPGVLLLGQARGLHDDVHGQRLLNWVAAGNTLIMPVVESRDEEDEVALKGSNAILEQFGVSVARLSKQSSRVHPVELRLPDLAYPLLVARSNLRLEQKAQAARPLASDGTPASLLLFAHGRGRVLLLSTEVFSTHMLGYGDHGQLLLHLLQAEGAGATLSRVNALEMPAWYEQLWQSYAPAVLAAAAGLMLWLWQAARRFGPLLPEAEQPRRAIIEHIDASGRWLWSRPDGPALLLQEVRTATLHIIERRRPALLRLSAGEQLQLLAGDTGLDRAELELALFAAPAGQPAAFTHQISLLQGLRHHYER